jgi:phosphohistidine phosphatase SixA
MRPTSTFLLLLLCSLVTSATTALAQPATIIIVRHADKAGTATDALLSDAGKVRALALAHVLRDANISTIFVTELQRTQQTAAPLAKALKLKPEVVQSSDAAAALAAKLKALPAGSTVLVVNHNPTVLRLAEALGAKNVASMQESEFDRLMILTRGADGNASLLTLRYGASTSTQ